MKKPEDFYQEIRSILAQEKSEYLDLLDSKTSESDPREVFLWLNKLYDEGKLPKTLGPLLTDFFFSIH